MKVKELIERLQNCEMPEAEVEIAVRTYTRRYPVAYVTPDTYGHEFLPRLDGRGGQAGTVRLEISLPSDGGTYMTTSVRKK